jgi:hypothetical protein
MKRLFVRACVISLLAAPAGAHHSGSMFDFSKCRELTGTAIKLEWTYPHSWLWINVIGEGGAVSAWGFEFMSPLQAMGLDPAWKRDAIVRGDKVTVKFAPHRDGRTAGALSSVVIPSGKSLPGTPGLCNTAPRT